MQILIGSDPEIFIKKNSKFISAHGIIPGNKKNPFKVNSGAIQVDGMALEINPNPASTFKDFNHNITEVLRQLREMIPKDIEIIFDIVAEFDEQYVLNQPEEAKMLGCDADYNAYTKKENPPPFNHPTMRTASGAVHIGWTENQAVLSDEHFEPCCSLAKQLDYFIGIPSILLEKENNRRLMYGNAGAFRPKPYGMEYRTLSNFWVDSENYRRIVYNNIIKGFKELIENDFHAYIELKRYNPRYIIQSRYKRYAEEIVKILDLEI